MSLAHENMNKEKIFEFESFLEKEVASATKELEPLPEQSRKHLQKLVYTNLIDRFDSMIDHVFLDNALHEELLKEAV